MCLLKTKFLQCDTNVNLLVSPFRQPFSHETELWLNKVKWETTNFHAMTGSETDILVAFIDDKYVNLESISRATSLKWLSDHKRSLACDFSLV